MIATPRAAGLIAAVVTFLADQGVKLLVFGPLELERRLSIDVVPFFRLTSVGNDGVSMGFLSPHGTIMTWLIAHSGMAHATPDQQASVTQWVLVTLTSIVAAAVLVWLWRERVRSDAFALGLVLGGALGNITDRVRIGYVADFLDLHFGTFRPFLVFNIADAAISIGVLLLVLRALLTRERRDPAENVNA